MVLYYCLILVLFLCQKNEDYSVLAADGGKNFFAGLGSAIVRKTKEGEYDDARRISAKFDEYVLARSAEPKEKEGVTVWYADGELSDPATGYVHAKVIGAEVVTAIAGHENEKKFAYGRCFKYLDPTSHQNFENNGSSFLKNEARQPDAYAAVVAHRLDNDQKSVKTEAIILNSHSQYHQKLKKIIPSYAKFSYDSQTGTSRLDTYLTPEAEANDRSQTPLIQIAGSGPQKPAVARAKRGLRCRESYILHRNKDVFTYTRFGECPPWLGPGKLCALDLSLRRKHSFSSSPSRSPQVYQHLLLNQQAEVEARFKLANLLTQGTHLSSFAFSHSSLLQNEDERRARGPGLSKLFFFDKKKSTIEVTQQNR
mmetsp:Transcript_6289/g.8824  ORF Transcript_6289/g.8824 Transcript_6289/m.8824 type:complete len:368 (-) Transcript_6289:215-1318(-)